LHIVAAAAFCQCVLSVTVELATHAAAYRIVWPAGWVIPCQLQGGFARGNNSECYRPVVQCPAPSQLHSCSKHLASTLVKAAGRSASGRATFAYFRSAFLRKKALWCYTVPESMSSTASRRPSGVTTGTTTSDCTRDTWARRKLGSDSLVNTRAHWWCCNAMHRHSHF
jgi:hypothetical protein